MAEPCARSRRALEVVGLASCARSRVCGNASSEDLEGVLTEPRGVAFVRSMVTQPRALCLWYGRELPNLRRCCGGLGGLGGLTITCLRREPALIGY